MGLVILGCLLGQSNELSINISVLLVLLLFLKDNYIYE